MAWWWWVGGFALVIVGVKPARRALKRQILKVIHRKAQRRPRATSRPVARRRPVKRRPSTPWKPVAPVVQPGVKPAKPLSVLRPQRCSAACRQSRKPASTCDCACGGRDHGRYVPGTAAAIRATRYTPEQKAAQRRAVEAAARQRWADKQKKLQAKGKPITRGGKGGQAS